MKPAKKKRTPKPLATPKGGDVLDWPAELGLRDDFVEQVEQQCKRNSARRKRLAAGACTALVLVFFSVFWAVPYARFTSTASAPTAQLSTVLLPDGSTVELNAGSEISTDFRYGRRHVRLAKGEAFFSVAKDPAHPFLVETEGGTVRVTGTEFNVRRENEKKTEVALLKGAVTMELGEKGSVSLSPGECFDPVSATARRLSEEDLAGLTAWRQGLFCFDHLSLAEAAARLSAYHGCRIQISSDAANLRAYGSYPVGDLKALLGALEKALGVRVTDEGRGVYRVELQ